MHGIPHTRPGERSDCKLHVDPVFCATPKVIKMSGIAVRPASGLLWSPGMLGKWPASGSSPASKRCGVRRSSGSRRQRDTRIDKCTSLGVAPWRRHRGRGDQCPPTLQNKKSEMMEGRKAVGRPTAGLLTGSEAGQTVPCAVRPPSRLTPVLTK